MTKDIIRTMRPVRRGAWWVALGDHPGGAWGSRCSTLVTLRGQPTAQVYETIEQAGLDWEVYPSWQACERAIQAAGQATGAAGGRGS